VQVLVPSINSDSFARVSIILVDRKEDSGVGGAGESVFTAGKSEGLEFPTFSRRRVTLWIAGV